MLENSAILFEPADLRTGASFLACEKARLEPPEDLEPFGRGLKSLLWKILAVSPSGSRFRTPPVRCSAVKSPGMRILREEPKKFPTIVENRTVRTLANLHENSFDTPASGDPRVILRFPAKSLFRNILAVTPFGSIFCGDQASVPYGKSLRMNILEKTSEKIDEAAAIPSHSHSESSSPQPAVQGSYPAEELPESQASAGATWASGFAHLSRAMGQYKAYA